MQLGYGLIQLVDDNNEIYSQYERHDFKSVNLKDQPAHGACTMIRTRLLKNIGGYNKDFFCGYSPERINPGDKIKTLTKVTKITSGSTCLLYTSDTADE